MSSSGKCQNCGKTGYTKKKCDHCGHLACGHCNNGSLCKVCRKGSMRPV